MSGPEVRLVFDLSSPAAYLAYTQLPTLVARTGASIVWRPVLLGGLLKAAGNPSPLVSPAKRAYQMRDMERWAERYGVPLRWPSPFPIGSALQVMRGALVARRHETLETYVHAAFRAIFADGRGLNRPEELATVAKEAGLEVGTFLAALDDQAIKDELRRETETAAAQGAFGVPTFFVGDEILFGQDRLDFVTEALRAERSSSPIKIGRRATAESSSTRP